MPEPTPIGDANRDHAATASGPESGPEGAPSTEAAGRNGTADPAAGLSILGSTVRHAVDHVECFPAPQGCSLVRFSTEELSSVCPVTGQPDLSSIVIEYVPDAFCVESKSLKLYLWSFRDRAIFAEALAVAVAQEVVTTAQPRWVRVSVTQRPRGGIELQTVSEMGSRA